MKVHDLHIQSGATFTQIEVAVGRDWEGYPFRRVRVEAEFQAGSMVFYICRRQIQIGPHPTGFACYTYAGRLVNRTNSDSIKRCYVLAMKGLQAEKYESKLREKIDQSFGTHL